MRLFSERAQAFEQGHVQEQEWQFLINVRRNKLLGYWASGLFGLTGRDKENYARAVVVADFEEPGDEDVLRKVHRDLNDRGHPHSPQQVRQRMDQLMVMARHEVLSEQLSTDYTHELLMSYA
jgi:hypothetical protein